MQLLSYYNQYCHATKYCSLIGSQHRRRRAYTRVHARRRSRIAPILISGASTRVVSMLIWKSMCDFNVAGRDATL